MKWVEHKILDYVLVVEERKAVNATLYKGKEQIQSFSAVCNSIDEYDFLAGAKKAVERISSKTDLTRSQQRIVVKRIMRDLTDQHRVKYVKRRPGYIVMAGGRFFVMTHKPGTQYPTMNNPSDLYLKPNGTLGPLGPEWFLFVSEAHTAALRAGLSPIHVPGGYAPIPGVKKD